MDMDLSLRLVMCPTAIDEIQSIESIGSGSVIKLTWLQNVNFSIQLLYTLNVWSWVGGTKSISSEV